jgi:hypothetical protein
MTVISAAQIFLLFSILPIKLEILTSFKLLLAEADSIKLLTSRLGKFISVTGPYLSDLLRQDVVSIGV